jgi:hypothetical protein
MAKRSMTDAKRRKANAEAQARWQAKHLKGSDGKKEKLTLVLDAGAKARLRRIAEYYGYRSITDLLERWSAETDSGMSEEIAKKQTAEASYYTCNN